MLCVVEKGNGQRRPSAQNAAPRTHGRGKGYNIMGKYRDRAGVIHEEHYILINGCLCQSFFLNGNFCCEPFSHCLVCNSRGKACWCYEGAVRSYFTRRVVRDAVRGTARATGIARHGRVTV